MIFYHGTTLKRANQIFNDNRIKCTVKRHYTKEKSGNGYTEDGFVYLATEPLFALYFANCCNLEDKSDSLFFPSSFLSTFKYNFLCFTSFIPFFLIFSFNLSF